MLLTEHSGDHIALHFLPTVALRRHDLPRHLRDLQNGCLDGIVAPSVAEEPAQLRCASARTIIVVCDLSDCDGMQSETLLRGALSGMRSMHTSRSCDSSGASSRFEFNACLMVADRVVVMVALASRATKSTSKPPIPTYDRCASPSNGDNAAPHTDPGRKSPQLIQGSTSDWSAH